MNYIIENKDWIFSGIGIFIISVIIYAVKFFIKNKSSHESSLPLNIHSLPKENNNLPNSQVGRKIDSPINNDLTTLNILDEIKNTPLLQQKDLIKSYIGQNINWETQISSITEIGKNKVTLQLNTHAQITSKPKGETYSLIYCNVNLNNYPELRMMKIGANITIEGKIDMIKPPKFDVSDVKLHY